jgi:general secretion pathway protein G
MKEHCMTNQTERRRDRSRAGFTLIEIMVVVVIIGMLAGVAGLRLQQRVNESRITGARANLHNIGMAISMYQLDTGTLPPNLAALMTQPAGARNWRGPYMEYLPQDPWGDDFQYQPGSDGSYQLSSKGGDGPAIHRGDESR